jgi:hypothetical protein
MNGILQGSHIDQWLIPELSVHVKALLGLHAEDPEAPIPIFEQIPRAWKDWNNEDLAAYHSVH